MVARADVDLLAQLDAEHWQHYSQSPIFMAPHTGRAAATWHHFLNQPHHSVWLALAGVDPAGYLCFAGGDGLDGVDLLGGDGIVGISGAYVRPGYRGQGVAPALLDAALCAYASQGMTSCAVNFEAFNLEAAAFWPRYFTPVCLSVLRVPEWVDGS